MTRLASRTPRRLPMRRRGVALLELALVMPFLAFLLLGVFDFGRAFSEQEAVTNAARQGARLAARQAELQSYTTPAPPALDDNAVKQAVLTELNLNGNRLNGAATITTGNITVTRSDATVALCDATSNHTVSVRVDYQHDILFGLLGRLWNNGQLNMSVQATMPYCKLNP